MEGTSTLGLVHRNQHNERLDLRAVAQIMRSEPKEYGVEISFVNYPTSTQDKEDGVVLDFTALTPEDADHLVRIVTSYGVRLSHFGP